MSQLEDNTELIEQREREIQSVVRSISEINEMYKDLATMVVEQVRNRRREGEGGREGEREGGRELNVKFKKIKMKLFVCL